MHANSQLLYLQYGLRHVHPGMRVLEPGPDAEHTLRRLTTEQVADLVWETADLRDHSMSEDVTHRMPDEYTFPVPDETFDLVVTSNVLEHVRKPWRWFPEAARVLRPGGTIVTVAPANWPYHASPHDCWRYFPDGFEALHEDAGLETIDARFESLVDTGTRANSWLEMRRRDTRVFVKRALRRPAWPNGGMEHEWAVDTIAVGRKPL